MPCSSTRRPWRSTRTGPASPSTARGSSTSATSTRTSGASTRNRTRRPRAGSTRARRGCSSAASAGRRWPSMPRWCPPSRKRRCCDGSRRRPPGASACWRTASTRGISIRRATGRIRILPGAAPVVFTGAMDYHANVDAVRWFAEAALPSIRAAMPDAIFAIVGSNPAPPVRALAGADGVLVTGRVADIRPYLAHAAVVVAPLRIARGVQNKVLEALAMARPVVATANAVQGIPGAAQAGVCVRDAAEGLAAAVIERLARDDSAARRRTAPGAGALRVAGAGRHCRRAAVCAARLSGPMPSRRRRDTRQYEHGHRPAARRAARGTHGPARPARVRIPRDAAIRSVPSGSPT